VTIRTPHVWRYHHVLSLTRRGEAHSLWLLWEEDWAFRCWYVQLWKPIVETSTGIETMDYALDIVVDPDGTWSWKDEDDFDEAQKLGVFTPEEAAAVRAEGGRVIAAHPWPTGWEDWRPWADLP
jgi:predicted RNA-binding protein associated with RNAse of E/G family